MKGRRAWKKVLAGILTGTMLIGTLSSVSASTSVDNVDASGWWVNHSAGIELADGTVTTITFTGTTYETTEEIDASYNWNTPIYVVYSADETFAGGGDISNTSGYLEYYVMRSDVYGWGDYGYYDTMSCPSDDDEWAAWLAESKKGLTGTITATLVGSTLVVDYVYGSCETICYITVDASKPVYLSLTGELCTVTDISYDVEDVEWDVSVSLDDAEPFTGQEVTATVTIYGNGIELTDLSNYYLWMWVDYWDDGHTDGITNYDEWYNGEEGKSFSKTFVANEAGTCYFDVELQNSSYTQIDKISTSAAVTEAKTVTDVSTTLPNLKMGDAFAMKGQWVTLTFEDGTSVDAKFSSNYISCKGYGISANLYDSNGQYCSDVYTAGTYTVNLYVYDSNGNSVGTYSFEVVVDEIYANDLAATKLTLDVSESATIDGIDSQWYYYECTTDNTYLFVSSNQSNGDPYGILYVADDEGKLSYLSYGDDTSDSPNFTIKYALESGKTYYLKARTYGYNNTSTVTYDVTVTEAKAITGISLDTLAKSTFTQYEDYLEEGGTTLTVTYADSTTATVTFNGSYAVDEYLNYIYCYLADGTAQYGAYSPIIVDAGTYTLSFYTYDTADGSEVSADTTVTVVEGDLTVIELLETEYTASAAADGSDVWFAYTPAADGHYYFVSSASTTSTDYDFSINNSLLYLNSDGNLSYVDPDQDESTGDVYYDFDSGRAYVYTLTAGTTYYFRCYYYDYNSDQVDATITVTAMQENHTHTYDDKLITWTWSDDYSTATAVLRCDACADTVSLVGTVTSVTVDATATTDGSITYTATATYNNVTYTDTKTVTIAATGATTDDGTTTNTEDGTTTDTEDTDTEDEDTEDEDDSTSASDYDFNITVEETTVTSTEAWSSVTAGEVTLSGDSVTVYTITVDETYGDDWFSVEIYDANGNYITLNSDGTYWYYGTTGDDIVMTGEAITLEEGMTYTVEVVRDGSDFTVTFYDEDGNELLSYYAANTDIEEVAETHVYAQVGSYTVSAEAYGEEVESLYDTEDNGENTEDDSNKTSSGSPKTGDADFALFLLIAAMGCVLLATAGKKRFVK